MHLFQGQDEMKRSYFCKQHSWTACSCQPFQTLLQHHVLVVVVVTVVVDVKAYNVQLILSETNYIGHYKGDLNISERSILKLIRQVVLICVLSIFKVKALVTQTTVITLYNHKVPCNKHICDYNKLFQHKLKELVIVTSIKSVKSTGVDPSIHCFFFIFRFLLLNLSICNK